MAFQEFCPIWTCPTALIMYLPAEAAGRKNQGLPTKFTLQKNLTDLTNYISIAKFQDYRETALAGQTE